MSHELKEKEKEKEKLLSKNTDTMFAGKSFLILINTTSITSFISFYASFYFYHYVILQNIQSKVAQAIFYFKDY
jgi:hypothetical protein